MLPRRDVVDAQTGRSATVEFRTLADFAAAVAEATGIAAEDQIVLAGCFTPAKGRAFEVTRRVGRLETSRRVFVYSKSLWSSGGDSFVAQTLQPRDVVVPRDPSEAELGLSPRPSQSNPLLKALLEYERKLHFQHAQARALLAGSLNRANACASCLEESGMVELALLAALSTVEKYFSSSSSEYERVRERFEESQAKSSKALAAYERVRDVLSALALHPSLHSSHVSSSGSSSSVASQLAPPVQRTLADCVPLDKLGNWSAQASQHADSLASAGRKLALKFERVAKKVGELLALRGEIEAHVMEPRESSTEASETQLSNAVPSDLVLLRDDLDGVGVKELYAKVVALVAGQETIVAALGSDAKDATSRVDGVLEGAQLPDAASESGVAAVAIARRPSSGTAALEACAVLEELHNRHERETLCQLREKDSEMLPVMDACARAKCQVQTEMARRMRALGNAQAMIKELQQQIGLAEEGLAVQDELVQQLMTVVRMPTAYAASVGEVVRRRTFGRLFKRRIEEFQEEIAKMRDEEVARREAFLNVHGKYLPANVVPSLAGGVAIPHCELFVHQFDTELPSLDASAVRDVYAHLQQVLADFGVSDAEIDCVP